jgi:GNAT superfamily N-acetyltransferase
VADIWKRVEKQTDNLSLVEMYKSFEPKRVAQGLPPPDVRRIGLWLDQLHDKSRSLPALDRKGIAARAILCPISDASMEFTVFVYQDFRRAGLGTVLAWLATEFARHQGFAEHFLTTELSNVTALRVYNKVGFRITSYFGSECEMKLVLAQSPGERPLAALTFLTSTWDGPFSTHKYTHPASVGMTHLTRVLRVT